MGRKILFVTTDQQRYDTLGCNGGELSRTPVVDALAAQGVRYERAVPQSVVCMPSRSTMLTGQHPSTHGVWMNGVALPVESAAVRSATGPPLRSITVTSMAMTSAPARNRGVDGACCADTVDATSSKTPDSDRIADDYRPAGRI